jgi:hypothetical protein
MYLVSRYLHSRAQYRPVSLASLTEKSLVTRQLPDLTSAQERSRQQFVKGGLVVSMSVLSFCGTEDSCVARSRQVYMNWKHCLLSIYRGRSKLVATCECFRFLPAPTLPCLGDALGLEDSSTFRASTITYCLPRLPAASHDCLVVTEPDNCTNLW